MVMPMWANVDILAASSFSENSESCVLRLVELLWLWDASAHGLVSRGNQ